MVDRLPQEVTRFINKHIHGLTQLELLIHLHGQPEEVVDARAMAREHRLPEDQAGALLHDLYSRGLLVAVKDHEGHRSYRFSPKTRELAREVDAVAETYPTYRHSIIQLIFSKPPESVTNFAEAFRLRKDGDDG